MKGEPLATVPTEDGPRSLKKNIGAKTKVRGLEHIYVGGAKVWGPTSKNRGGIWKIQGQCPQAPMSFEPCNSVNAIYHGIL